MRGIPQRPMESRWTDEQWQAIHARGSNILVAAAAGSGKTAVLVERIIRRISDEQQPIDTDRLLVVTFTKAAASEMKGRIRDALEKELRNKPWSLHLRRQLMLLNRASISTLHSFCMEVVKRYSYMLDIDPAFRVADENEVKLLRQDVLDQLFEEEYGEGQAGSLFFTLVDWFGSDRSDHQLQGIIEKLYDYAQSHPWPEIWLEEMIALYQVDAAVDFDSLPWVKELKREIGLELQGVKAVLQSALEMAGEPSGPAPYIDQLSMELSMIEEAIKKTDGKWREMEEAVTSVRFERLKAIRGDQYDEELKEEVKNIRNEAKARIQKLQSNFLAIPPQRMVEDLARIYPVMRELVRLVRRFSAQYRQVKREKGLVDFSDLEHYCLKILRDPNSTPQELIPSEAALAYRSHYEEILVDEYQDTNMVQESILKLISREESNLFMVGDVKQSIYRFRLTEPKLFLEKYEAYHKEGGGAGLRIDLAKNFRSRAEILAGINFIFKQIMRQDVAEIDYDEAAELIPGADYPPVEDTAIELLLIDQQLIAEERKEEREDPDEDQGVDSDEEVEELTKAQLEARLIAKQIKTMMHNREQIYDRKLKSMRPVTYRDIVILLRATSAWAPIFLEEFRAVGIPAYAELSGGYFAATEIEVMLSLLRIVDNPYQDIPLAAVLRSPILQLTADQLAQLRIVRPEGSYYEAVLAYLETDNEHADPELKKRLSDFYQRLQRWRTAAREGALSTLIWSIYQETGYYDFVGGLPGGNQRQANLRALYDRARQFESTSFRGLFRFLRFVERMQERGDEMGTARALGEQEDVVRMMTIHKSKGLEFPIVFIAGLAKPFNQQDLRSSLLYHKELGFGSKYVDTDLRVSYPTLPQLAIKRRLWLELLAEEMRLLYVALTRAQERCLLTGTVKNLGKELRKWTEALRCSAWQLPSYLLAKSNTCLDWIGYSVIRHADAIPLREGIKTKGDRNVYLNDPASKWKVSIYRSTELLKMQDEAEARNQEIWDAISAWQPIPTAVRENQEIERRLSWSYPYQLAVKQMAKQSVSEIKRRLQIFSENESEAFSRRQIIDRPGFMEKKGLSPAEKGTAMHMVMQQIELGQPPEQIDLEREIAGMVERELLTPEQAGAIDRAQIERFLHGPLGVRMREARNILREVPFSYAMPVTEIDKDWDQEEEAVLIQGIIDCLIEEEDGWTLLDYKTDYTRGKTDQELAERYRIQVELYARAVEEIWRIKLKQKLLYFFDGERIIVM